VLSGRLDLDFQLCIEFPNAPWNIDLLSTHPRLSFDIVVPLRKRWSPLHFDNLSEHPLLTLKFVVDNASLNWRWSLLTKRISFLPHSPFTVKYVIQHAGLPWDWAKVMKHPDLTFSFIIKAPHFHSHGLAKSAMHLHFSAFHIFAVVFLSDIIFVIRPPLLNFFLRTQTCPMTGHA
jgi:hypothetical protein